MRLAAGGPLASCSPCPPPPHPPAHDTAFWMALAAKDFAVPEGESAGALALEAADLLSSPDPALRDGVGYEALARWVYGDGLVPPADLERLRLRLQAGLKKGPRRDERRLGLRAVVLRHRPLDPRRRRPEDARGSRRRRSTTSSRPRPPTSAPRRTLRGFVAGSGWVHATAHTADVLKFLARNPKLTPAGQARIVEAVADAPPDRRRRLHLGRGRAARARPPLADAPEGLRPETVRGVARGARRREHRPLEERPGDRPGGLRPGPGAEAGARPPRGPPRPRGGGRRRRSARR